ncbi:hypothetical protein B0H14DRAFT_2559902 [Mycena olivaceomarginata]|nr:hypothetical protein B0H14DRAFT_2559902 [Mycena olivaceomarginata]
MFAIEPSFIRVAIRGCANLPQNRKTLNYKDIKYTTYCSVHERTIDGIDGLKILFCSRYCIVLLKICVLYDDITATLAGTLLPVNTFLYANWRGNTTDFRYSPPSANFKPTNTTLHGQIWLNFDWMREGRKRNNRWPELSESLAVDAGAKIGCTGAAGITGKLLLFDPSWLIPIERSTMAFNAQIEWSRDEMSPAFRDEIGAIKNNYLIVFRGGRDLMRDGVLPKREKTPERTVPSWYTPNIVTDDELAWLENIDSAQGSLTRNLAASRMIYQLRLWPRDLDISRTVSRERW